MALLSQLLMGAPATSEEDEWRRVALADLLGKIPGDAFKRSTDADAVVGATMRDAPGGVDVARGATGDVFKRNRDADIIGTAPPTSDAYLSTENATYPRSSSEERMDRNWSEYLAAAARARGGETETAPTPTASGRLDEGPWDPVGMGSTDVKARPPVGMDYGPATETPRDITDRTVSAAAAAPDTKGGGPTDRTPTIWDRMTALGRGYASGGLVGAIGDAGNIDRAFEDRNATVKAIADKINDPQLARVIAADPELLKVVMTNVLTPKAGSWEKIEYTDEAGRPAVGLYNKTSPNAGIIRVGSGKSDMPADLVTKLAQVRTSIEALKRARPVFERDYGLISPETGRLAFSNTPAGDISAVSGEIGRARRDMMQSAEGAIRIASGAAVPEPEMARYVQMYVPTVTDTLASRKQKLDNLSTFLDELATAIQTKGRVLSAQEVADIHARSSARASGAPSGGAPAAGGTPGRPDPLGLRR